MGRRFGIVNPDGRDPKQALKRVSEKCDAVPGGVDILNALMNGLIQ
jgi:hypothetical protein